MVLGLQDCLFLGNMNAKRDWGHARDYVEMQWLMLQQDHAEDFCDRHRAAVFCARLCQRGCRQGFEVSLSWQGEGVDETGAVAAVDVNRLRQVAGNRQGLECSLKQGRWLCVLIRVISALPVETLLGQPAKAKEKLGWEPKTSFEDMVAEMAREDLALSMRDAVCKVAGFKTFSHNE